MFSKISHFLLVKILPVRFFLPRIFCLRFSIAKFLGIEFLPNLCVVRAPQINFTCVSIFGKNMGPGPLHVKVPTLTRKTTLQLTSKNQKKHQNFKMSDK